MLEATASEHELNWIQQRIKGQIATLEWLCLRYLNQLDIKWSAVSNSFVTLEQQITRQHWAEAIESLSFLKYRFPLKFSIPKLADLPTEVIQNGQGLYTTYCHGCHMQSQPLQTPPVYSLASMTQTLPKKEFIARMIIGVHGTSEIALRNPLSDLDIIGIYVYLLGQNNG